MTTINLPELNRRDLCWIKAAAAWRFQWKLGFPSFASRSGSVFDGGFRRLKYSPSTAAGPMSEKNFSQDLERLGYSRRLLHGRKVWDGLGVVAS